MLLPVPDAFRHLCPVRVVQVARGQMSRIVELRGTPGMGLAPDQIRAEAEAGRLRAEWTFAAVDHTGRPVGRAMWWGRDVERPIALDVWDVRPQVPGRLHVAATLLRSGHESFSRSGISVPLPHTVRVPNGWHDVEALTAEVAWRVRAARLAGLSEVNERLQFQWDADQKLPTATAELVFEPADDEAFVELFARATAGSVDVITQRELRTTTAFDLARNEVEYYLSCPGERSWWRIGSKRDGTVVGVAIPSATPTNRNVGYLAVLPEHRGHGYVDPLLTYITRFHAHQGAKRITGTTDAVNEPMAAAFRRAGYCNVETRIDLEAP